MLGDTRQVRELRYATGATLLKYNSMSEKKNQHYVPQFYQRYFSNDKKTVAVYILKSKKYIAKSPIKNQASEDYFYSKDEHDTKIESALGKLEALSKDALDRIISNPKEKLSEQDNYTLYHFMMIQLGRTLSQANLMQELVDKISRNIVKAIVKLKKENGDTEDAKILTDDVLDSVQIKLKKPGIIALGTTIEIRALCIDLKCKILINNTKVDFISSDNPVCFYDQFLEKMGDDTHGLGVKGLQLFLPLTPRIGVFYYDPVVYKLGERKKTYVDVGNDNDVKELNKLVSANANEILIFNSASYLPADFTNYSILHHRFSTKELVESFTLESFDGSGPIIGNHTVTRYFRMKLSFVKLLPKYAAKEKNDYKPKDRFREIAYYKDELLKYSRQIFRSKHNKANISGN